MAYYTNSNPIQEVMTSLVDVPVKTLEKIPKERWSDLTLYIFDNLFRDRALSTYRVGREDDAMTFKTLWEKRPEWGGTILETMKMMTRTSGIGCIFARMVWGWIFASSYARNLQC